MNILGGVGITTPTPSITPTATAVNAPDPYYVYIHKANKKLKPRAIAEIINANKKYSSKYGVSMFWHMCKTGYESKFNSETGDTFVVGGHKYNNEPCYGIECLQVSTVRGMHPELTDAQIKHKLLHDYTFSVECAYRLDFANKLEAYKKGYKSEYANRVFILIVYNSGVGSWKKYHQGLSKYIKRGGKLEKITLMDWKELRLNFREIYSLNYYSKILEQVDILNGIIHSPSEE